MAAGDVFNQGVTSVSNNGYFSIQPGSNVEVVIHNISCGGAATLEFYDGSTAVTVDSRGAGGSWMGMFLHCTNSKYYRVKNVSGGSANFCCDGMVTK